jgi:hypothetical protein
LEQAVRIEEGVEPSAGSVHWKECIGLAKYERLMKNRPPQPEAEENAA